MPGRPRHFRQVKPDSGPGRSHIYHFEFNFQLHCHQPNNKHIKVDDMHSAIERFQSFYKDLIQSTDNLNPNLQAVYSDDINFIDPIHHLNGIDALAAYLQSNCANLVSCGFEVQQVNECEQQAYIHWLMRYQHPKLNSGRINSIEGVSHIKFTDKVHYHRDYFDVGNMMYEKLPLIGTVIRYLKNRMQQ